ncbi:MAG TPA: glycosyltransferase [Chloroflexota bacterium]|nr:glycosyltransferase [Chloroflexota bacterium]
MLRVAHVYKDIFPVVGGIENHIRLLCRELARQPDIQPHILVTSLDRRSQAGRLDGVPITRAGRLASAASTPLSPRLAIELRRIRPDIVHLHFPYPVGEVAALLAVPRVPTIITYHSDIIRQRSLLMLYGPLLRIVLKRAHAIIATSDAYLASSKWLTPNRDRCRIIPLGIDLAPFLPLQPRGDGHTILFVGRFRYYKGLHYLLDALSHIPNARLLLVGSGGQEDELRAQTERLGLGQRVEFLTQVQDTDLPALYARADLFALPACERSEAFGLVLVEAAASGLPLLSTELGTGTSYVNLNRQTGLVVPPRDSAALAGACNKLLADPTLRAAYGAAARTRARQHFSIDRVANQVADLYREVAASRNR